MILNSEHRHNIDGLRALAVLSAVFYHQDYVHVSGGFAGVDVFFVISGFVITWSHGASKKREIFPFSILMPVVYAASFQPLLP